MTRFILLFIYVWAGPSWGVITSEVKTYNYDVVTESIVNKNVKLNQQNFTYDDTQNFHYCCSESLNSSREVKALVGSFFAFEVGLVATKGASKEITKSSRKRVKKLVKNLSDNSRQSNGLSQKKTDQLRRIVEKAGGKVRNDGTAGVKGSSAGKPHVQTEGLGKSIDSRHIWTKEGVQ